MGAFTNSSLSWRLKFRLGFSKRLMQEAEKSIEILILMWYLSDKMGDSRALKHIHFSLKIFAKIWNSIRWES